MAERAKQQEQERLHASIIQKWSTKAAHFVTPGLRPLADPPLLDWKKFNRTHIFSDLRYEKLFPLYGENGKLDKKAKEKRARMKDLKGEAAALFEYMYWLQRILEEGEEGEEVELDGEMVAIDEKRREFYRNLQEDLNEDFIVVEKEMEDLLNTAPGVGRFEFTFLTNAGKVDRIKDWLSKGADIFEGYGDEATKKYGHLKPEGWEAVADKTLESQQTDQDGGAARIHYDYRRREKQSSLFTIRLSHKHRHLRYTKLEMRNMWTLPGPRPLAEPPVLDCWSFSEYETQMHIEPCRETDDEYKALFPWTLERLRYLNDLRMEEAALVEYHTWAGSQQMANLAENHVDFPHHKARHNFYLDLGMEIYEDIVGEKGVAYEELAFWDRQGELLEEQRLKDIEDEKKAKEAAEMKAKLKAEAAELKRLKEEEEKERAEDEARKYGASWKGIVDINARSVLSFADRVVRARY